MHLTVKRVQFHQTQPSQFISWKDLILGLSKIFPPFSCHLILMLVVAFKSGGRLPTSNIMHKGGESFCIKLYTKANLRSSFKALLLIIMSILTFQSGMDYFNIMFFLSQISGNQSNSSPHQSPGFFPLY